MKRSEYFSLHSYVPVETNNTRSLREAFRNPLRHVRSLLLTWLLSFRLSSCSLRLFVPLLPLMSFRKGYSLFKR